jgi:hypothetical protein
MLTLTLCLCSGAIRIALIFRIIKLERSNHWHYCSDTLKKLYISPGPVVPLRVYLIHVYVQITYDPEHFAGHMSQNIVPR